MQNQLKLSVVAPMFNEQDNVLTSFNLIREELEKGNFDYEIIFVNDGSKDDTWKIANELAAKEERLKIVGYATNQGRGKAIRTGIDAATGDIIATVDFDLSYSADHITRMVNTLVQEDNIDTVLASCYMPGGQTIGIPPFRLFVSKVANHLYQHAFSQKIYTSTCVVRAYRAKAIQSLYLESDDKEIHLEVISKLIANGFKIKEIPGTLTSRQKGKSSFKFKSHSISHLLFFIHEKPFVVLGFISAFLTVVGLTFFSILLYTRFGEDAIFNESLISKIASPNSVILLLVSALQVGVVGFLGIQNSMLKKEMFKIQRLINEKKE